MLQRCHGSGEVQESPAARNRAADHSPAGMASGEIPARWGLGSGAESLRSSPGLRRIYFGACGGSRCSGAVGSRRSRGAAKQSSAEAAALGFVGRRLRMGEQGVRRGLLIGRRRPWRARTRLGSRRKLRRGSRQRGGEEGGLACGATASAAAGACGRCGVRCRQVGPGAR